jgi:hypothetical protein
MIFSQDAMVERVWNSLSAPKCFVFGRSEGKCRIVVVFGHFRNSRRGGENDPSGSSRTRLYSKTRQTVFLDQTSERSSVFASLRSSLRDISAMFF